MWLIEGEKETVLVDLAPPDPAQVMKNHGFVMNRSHGQHPLEALKRINIRPDDIKTVLMTHLHWDHAWGFDLFPNAEFMIQRKEIEYAIAPFPCHRSLYYEISIGKPQFVDYLEQVKAIDGDYEIHEDIRIVFIPSHSPGFQGIQVRTERGNYFIAGDAVGLYECWESSPPVVSGIFNNLKDYYASMHKIKRIADHILPGHDPKVLSKSYYP
jgi:glyoxylase-like metal-dependent hydrolase (beta-lactamase superfamily II)